MNERPVEVCPTCGRRVHLGKTDSGKSRFARHFWKVNHVKETCPMSHKPVIAAQSAEGGARE